MVLLKYSAVAVASAIWLGGLAEQWHSWELTGKYLVISALMAVAALL